MTREIRHGDYTARVVEEGIDRWGHLCTVWEVTRDGEEVGRMFRDGKYGRLMTHGSMRALVWAGPLPKGHADSRSKHYGIHFDTPPHETTVDALVDFVRRADRLIAWRQEGA